MMMKRCFAALVLATTTAAWAAPADKLSPASVNAHYAELVFANYSDSLNSAIDMRKAVEAFIASPSQQTLDAARKSWLEAREWYLQTEAFRFYGGPIDDKRAIEGRINSWPMDESFVDSVKDKPNAGLINNPKFKISEATLGEQNERGGEENIATGWHAIEFLLWGQDFNDNGPGNRNFEDFIDGKAPNADRRRQYLSVVTNLLVKDLGAVTSDWKPGATYRSAFEKGGQESIRKIFVGLGSLSRGELAGERMEVALASQDQEDEQSCFSDNTHRDLVNDALGIENVWLGRYVKRDGSTLQGPSLQALLSAKNSTLAQQTSQQIAESVANTKAIHAPFDREIIGGDDAPGRLRIQKAIDSVVKQSESLVSSANELGIKKLTLTQP